MHPASTRADRERAHGAHLSQFDPEAIWGWKTPAGQRRASRRAALLVEAARLGPGVRVLEIGCGTGLFTERLAASGASITAVDVSPDLLERARARTLPNVRCVLGDFLEVAFEEPFDAVVGSSVLHHLPVAASLDRIRELLRPGGRVAFAEPNYLNPQVWLERTFRFLPYYAAYTSPDETAFVRWQIAGALADAGFEAVSVHPHDWLHPATPARWLDRVARVGGAIERVPGLRECAGSLLISAARP